MGLEEVERISKRMKDIIERESKKNSKVRKDMTIMEFSEHMKTIPELTFQKDEDVAKSYTDVCTKIEKILPKYFSLFPKSSVKVTPLKTGPAAYYLVGTPDGSRKGEFRVNTAGRNAKYEQIALTLHEAIPGHHMHCSLLMENTKFPKFRKFVEDRRYDIAPCRRPLYTASFEGWALYCEALGEEMGMYE
eukprot:UN24601